ncbi:MAG TPA: ISL3 family transposase, partial [Gemmatimonadaceae bacterium]
MEDRELYQTILGLSVPWIVARVELKEAEQAVCVWVEETAGTVFSCPECQKIAPIYDRAERRWRHLDTCQFTTVICARVPRVACPTHGVKTVRVPWAERGSRFTLLFERLAIAWLKEATPAAVARRLGLTWDEARGIMERAVRRGLARRTREPVARLGIDEKSFLKRHQYVSVVVDLDRACVLHVADDRKAESIVPYFEELTPEQRAGITAIAMDMWEPYRKTVREQVPAADAKIVFDKFHVLQHVSDAVDQVRKQESKALAAAGDSTLKGTKYAWLRNPVNFSPKAWREFAVLRDSTLKAARAW